jgi:hypothetical protein
MSESREEGVTKANTGDQQGRIIGKSKLTSLIRIPHESARCPRVSETLCEDDQEGEQRME